MTGQLEDPPREECGVFGVWAPGEEVAKLTYYGLYALQHRGQEAAGIAVADGKQFVACDDRAMEEDLLVAMDDPGQIDADIELFEDFQLHLTAGHGDEGQRRDDIGITGGLGGLLAEVHGVIGLNSRGVLADLLPADQKIVVISVVGSDDVAGE